jgi:UDP-glucose 4-epimerase
MLISSCIVLGGGGFLGTNLCRRLAGKGVHVRAFGRRCLFPHALDRVDWHAGDFSDSAALARAIEGHDIVFHLIHSKPANSTGLDLQEDLAQNVGSSLALLEICRKLGVKKIVFVSSGGTVYGAARQLPIPEDAPTNPIMGYGVSKLAIEKYLAVYEHLHGLCYRVLRLANPFGPFQLAVKGQGFIAHLISKALEDKPIEIWGDGSVIRDYIYVEDVIDSIEAAAADESDARIFNIGSGVGQSLNEVIAATERVLAKEIKREAQPHRAADVPASVLSINRAQEVLGWSPRTCFEDGLRLSVAWWQAYCKLP